MKKIIFKSVLTAIIVSSFITGASYATKYNCSWISPNGRTMHATEYSTSDSAYSRCSIWKGNNYYYNKCVEDFNETLKAYRAGKCEQIFEKHYKIDGCDCTIEYTKKSSSGYGYSCSGNCNTDAAMKKLKNQVVK